MTLYAEVVFSLPVDRSFSYIVPEAFKKKAKIGSRVLAPLGQRLLTGFIVNLSEKKPAEGYQLKEIAEVLDEEPVFSPSILSLTQKIGSYFYSSWGELLQSSLPPSFILRSQKKIFLSEKGKASLRDETLSAEERGLLALLQKRAYSIFYLKRKLKVKNLPLLVSRLERKNLVQVQSDIKAVRAKKEPALARMETQLEIDFSLDTHAREVADKIAQKMVKNGFSPFYLFGSPEKREAVYFYLIKKALVRERKVLLLVPEIVLTQALRDQFEKKLGERAAVLHSRLSERKRELEWRKIRQREVDVVVGSRSALFSPLVQLGLVIVDEEQDESFYQLESPSYDARKGAWLRAEQEGAVLVYGSAFPSVSAFSRAQRQGYLLSLESDRRRRKVEIIDDRQVRGLISMKLEEKIAGRLDKGEPVLVFFNRRGYASFLFCSRCNFIPRCKRCDIALSYHKRDESLVCHYCNDSIPKMDVCPECRSRMLRERGVGIEAVEEELRRKFPQSRVASFDTGLSRGEQARILRNFKKGKIPILIGTQFLAHQRDLAPVSLIVILFPETILSLSDYRASQKTFETVGQMMRFLDEEGEALIQTAVPRHFSILQAASGDYLSFFSEEIKFRRLMNYPPFSCVAEILFQGTNLRSVARNSRQFAGALKESAEGIEILGPALASVSKVRGMNRVQVTLKARKKEELDEILRRLLKTVKARKSVLLYE